MIHVGDNTWNLKVYITDLQVQKTLRVRGDLHIGGVMLRLVDPGKCFFAPQTCWARVSMYLCLYVRGKHCGENDGRGCTPKPDHLRELAAGVFVGGGKKENKLAKVYGEKISHPTGHHTGGRLPRGPVALACGAVAFGRWQVCMTHWNALLPITVGAHRTLVLKDCTHGWCYAS